MNCKSVFVIYVLECKKCHIQYVCKAEADFNSRLNNHPKDVLKADAIPASHDFGMKDHISDGDTSFIIRRSTLNRETKKKNFWIWKLEKPFSQSRLKQIKRSNQWTSIIRNVHLSSVHFNQSNSL